MNTNGFKKGRVIFEDLLYQNVSQAGGATSQDTEQPTGLNLGTGVRVVATEKSFTQGTTVNTGNSLDVMISGRGFFQVLLPDGSQAYTRDGSFKIDSEGRMVTASGYEVQPAINLPDGSDECHHCQRRTDPGHHHRPGGAGDTRHHADRRLHQPGRPAAARPESADRDCRQRYRRSSATPRLEGRGDLVQGSLEGSNVNVVEELVGMIETQRAYEMNSKAISTSEQMLQYLNNNL